MTSDLSDAPGDLIEKMNSFGPDGTLSLARGMNEKNSRNGMPYSRGFGCF